MGHIKKKLAILLMVFFHSALMADARKDAWYLTESGGHAVMESIYGSLYATIDTALDGDANVYFQLYNPDHCRENGERNIYHEPLAINGTLVQMAQRCRGEWNYFYASTTQGRMYVLNQFRQSRSVTVDAGSTSFIFSAIGFIDHYNQFSRNSKAL